MLLKMCWEKKLHVFTAETNLQQNKQQSLLNGTNTLVCLDWAYYHKK